jgi:hypothetical protein
MSESPKEAVRLVVTPDTYLARIERVKKAFELRLPLAVQKAEVELLLRSFNETPRDDHHDEIVDSYNRGLLPY